MKHLQILRVVVASPSDVQSERNSLEEVAAELNRGVAKNRALHIEISRWETDAAPGFHVEGPQGLIDSVLRIEDCDLLVGIFWKRFGTPTVDAKSGTEHEFRKAYEAWKRDNRPQIMMYFNEKPYSPKTRAETDQWGQVLDFKSEFPQEGLWWPYYGKTKFEKLVRHHITQFILQIPIADNAQLDSQRGFNNSSSAANITPTHNAPPIDEQVSLWLQSLGGRTKATYKSNIAKFREILRNHALDLDSGDENVIASLCEKWASQGIEQQEMSSSTYNLRCSIVSSFYMFARKQQWTKANPIKPVERRKEERPNAAQPLDLETVNNKLRLINRSTLLGKRDFALLCTLFITGRTVSEVADLRCGDIAIEEDNITITFQRCKGGKMKSKTLPRAVPVARALVDYLIAAYGSDRAIDAPVWKSYSRQHRGGPRMAISTQAISDVCKKYLGTGKVEVTRLTYLAMKEELGVKGIEKLLGKI
jgi:site-specific recombinase XerC